MEFDPIRSFGFLRGAAVGALLLFAAASNAAAQTPVVKAWSILNTASTDQSADKRAQAMAALALLVKNEQAEQLATNGLKDDKPDVRAAAASSLGLMQATGAIPALKNVIQTDTEPQVVLAAARSLLQLNDKAAYEVYYAVLTGKRKSGADLLSQQKKMLSDPKKLAQIGVETGIGFIPFGGLGMYAYKTLTSDKAAQVRAAAAKVLAKDPDPRSGQALVDAASDSSWIVRAAALDAIAQRDERSLGEKILPELDDDKPVVQYMAAAAIIRLDSAPAVKRSTRTQKPSNQ